MAASSNIRAISRGLNVLQAINQHRSLSMMEIAKICQIPYPTACRIVETLLDEQMIERENTRKHYRPTALVKTLSVGYQQDDDLAQASRRHVVELTRKLRWPISVCRHVGLSMMICESTHAIAPFTFNLYHPGYTMPILGSSSGKAYLAFCEEEDRKTIIEQVRKMSSSDSGRFVAALESEFKTIRNKGYATADRIRHTANPGKTSAISVPVHSEQALEGTITLAFFSSTMALPKAIELYIDSLKHTASAIGDDLARMRTAA
ncbi:MAG: IclR family transcriptional regulator domain-containing protein [Rhizomicrobium sp.]